MICLHCGQCCVQFDVVIINPKHAREGIVFEDLPEDGFIIKPGNTPCPHLYWDSDESRCMVHNYTWYKKTPCYDFTQVESKPSMLCRLGVYSIKTDGPEHWRLYTERVREQVLSPERITETFSASIRKEIKNGRPEPSRQIFQPDELRQMY